MPTRTLTDKLRALDPQAMEAWLMLQDGEGPVADAFTILDKLNPSERELFDRLYKERSRKSAKKGGTT